MAEVTEYNLGGDFTYTLAEEQKEEADDELLMPEEEPREETRRIRRTPDKVEYEGDDASAHQALILELARYGQSKRLGAYLNSLAFKLGPAHLRTLEIEELQAMRERVRVSILNKSGNDFVSGSFFAATHAAEVLVSKSPWSEQFPITGWSECLRKDETVGDLLEYLSISKAICMNSGEATLAMALLSSAGKVVAINKFLAHRAAVQAATEKKARQDEGGAEGPQPEQEAKEDEDDVIEFEAK